MKRILMADYYGTCDSAGNAVGHSAKVLREYRELLGGEFETGAAVSPCLARTVQTGGGEQFVRVHILKYDIYAAGMETLGGRIRDKLKLIRNIHQVLSLRDYDIIWFYRTDFFLFLYLFLTRKPGIKIVGQVYQEKFAAGKVSCILNYIYRKALRKLDGVIYSQEGMACGHENTLYIPDYYYDEKKYGKYKNIPKQEKAVCLGTMNPYKELTGLVKGFSRNKYELEIKGFFYDKRMYEELARMAGPGIKIEDRILSEEEYYSTLAEAKYAVLPYDMKQYENRTSGVLQECLFLGTAPIAPALLLKQNGMQGIGYNTIAELENLQNLTADFSWDRDILLRKYDRARIESQVKQFMERS